MPEAALAPSVLEGAALTGGGVGALAGGAALSGGIGLGTAAAVGGTALEESALTGSGVGGLAGGAALPGGITVGQGAATGAGFANTLKSVATVLSPAASIISAASGINSARAMGRLSGVPQVTAPVTMPIYSSGQTYQAMQDQAQVAAMRRGRAATILTAPAGEKLGS